MKEKKCMLVSPPVDGPVATTTKLTKGRAKMPPKSLRCIFFYITPFKNSLCHKEIFPEKYYLVQLFHNGFLCCISLFTKFPVPIFSNK